MMFSIASILGMASMLLPTVLGVDYIFHAPVPKKEGDECFFSENYPKSSCRLIRQCESVKTNVINNIWALDDIPSCGFADAGDSEMVCCPDTNTSEVEKVTTEPNLFSRDNTLRYKHLVSLGYWTDSLDEIVYRCTAILVSPNQVLATSKCAGKTLIDQPSRVLLGVSDLAELDASSLIIGIKGKIAQFKNDLALFNLTSSIDVIKDVKATASVATLCNEADLKEGKKMYAVGFAQGDDKNCALFESKPLIFGNCSDVQIPRDVEGPKTHLCMGPSPDYPDFPSTIDGCQKCLTTSTSVLHVEREDGSVCVAAIATPNTDRCIVDNQPSYYTSLASGAARKFLGIVDGNNDGNNNSNNNGNNDCSDIFTGELAGCKILTLIYY